MDEPASPAPETVASQPRKHRPLTPLQKRLYGILAALGLVIVSLAFYMANSSLPGFVIGGMAGAGGSLLAIGAMMLFHRPER